MYYVSDANRCGFLFNQINITLYDLISLANSKTGKLKTAF